MEILGDEISRTFALTLKKTQVIYKLILKQSNTLYRSLFMCEIMSRSYQILSLISALFLYFLSNFFLKYLRECFEVLTYD